MTKFSSDLKFAFGSSRALRTKPCARNSPRRASADPANAAEQAQRLLAHLRAGAVSLDGMEILDGRKAIEVRPAGLNKGHAVHRVLNVADFVLCCGDDTTDEDMFAALEAWAEWAAPPTGAVHTVLVRREDAAVSTRARMRVDAPADIGALLAELAATLST